MGSSFNSNRPDVLGDLLSAAIMAGMLGGCGKQKQEMKNGNITPTAEDEPKDAAKLAKAFFNAYFEAGFTEQQSFELTKISMENY